MIKCDRLIDLFEQMEQEHWNYEWGAAREGCVDCSGAFVYAFEQLGGPSIEHGSNSIFHLRLGAVRPMSQAKPGYVAVKVRPWKESEKGNRWYGYDPGDVYHMGLFGRDGRILNAQGEKTGFVSSDASTWDFCAPLLDVVYGETEDEEVIYQAIVNTEKDPLRVRQFAVNGKVLGSVPRGAVVDVLSESGDGWPRIRYNEMVGYASGDYLTRVEDSEADVAEDQSGSTTLMRMDGVSITLSGQWRIAED